MASQTKVLKLIAMKLSMAILKSKNERNMIAISAMKFTIKRMKDAFSPLSLSTQIIVPTVA
jgi:hypothetical protein